MHVSSVLGNYGNNVAWLPLGAGCLMVSHLRQQKLQDILRIKPAALVRDLAARLEVSQSTIRRDLNELERRGLVSRVHGGAILKTPIADEPSFEVRRATHGEEKSLTGKAAASLVKDGMILFVDGGTTTPFLIHHLTNHQNLTVVTIGHNVVNALARIPTISSIVLSGELDTGTQTYAGPLSLLALETCGLNFDLAFISAAGLRAQFGATNQILDRIPQKQMAISRARVTAIIVDGSKIGQVALGQIIPSHKIDYIVTDDSCPETEMKRLEAMGPKFILASKHELRPYSPQKC